MVSPSLDGLSREPRVWRYASTKSLSLIGQSFFGKSPVSMEKSRGISCESSESRHNWKRTFSGTAGRLRVLVVLPSSVLRLLLKLFNRR